MEERVQKLLSNYGFTSRRKAEDLIKEGKVKVNGRVVRLGDKAAENDIIYVNDEPVNKPKRVYLMFNKPLGYVTALEDKFHKTIMELIRTKERVFPIGRLDYNTSGLLLLTNDGDFANKIMHPKHEIKKTYMVTLDRPISMSHVEQVRRGVKLEEGKTRPAEVKKIEDTLLELTIHEGKKRIIRRMFKSIGYTVRALERVRIGNLSLGDLGYGKVRPLTPAERELIFQK